MVFLKGDKVKYITKLGWGIGTVLDESGIKHIRVRFPKVGIMLISPKESSKLRIVDTDETNTSIVTITPMPSETIKADT